MNVVTASEPEVLVISTDEGNQLEISVFRNSQKNLVVQSKLGMSFVLDQMSMLEACKRIIILLTAR